MELQQQKLIEIHAAGPHRVAAFQGVPSDSQLLSGMLSYNILLLKHHHRVGAVRQPRFQMLFIHSSSALRITQTYLAVCEVVDFLADVGDLWLCLIVARPPGYVFVGF